MEIGMEQLTQLIGSYGFPIFASIALFIQMNKLSQTYNEQMNKMNETNNAKNDEMTKAINNNTIALTKLATKIGGEEN